MKKLFIDMDGVIVDFERFMKKYDLTAKEVKVKPGAFFQMMPVAGAIEAIREIIELGEYDVFIATKAPTAVPGAYADKVSWIMKYLPELERKIIITHDKGLLGGPSDTLIDDRPEKANCREFPGRFIQFNVTGENLDYEWAEIKTLLNRGDL